jgi:hypothetical protein
MSFYRFDQKPSPHNHAGSGQKNPQVLFLFLSESSSFLNDIFHVYNLHPTTTPTDVGVISSD